jgi:hypothetical protein
VVVGDFRSFVEVVSEVLFSFAGQNLSMLATMVWLVLFVPHLKNIERQEWLN